MSIGEFQALSRRWLDSTRLFLLGFLTLFLELVLIRYLAGGIWNLGYFPNLVLLAVFVGMGFGFLLHHLVPGGSSPRLYHAAVLILLFLVLTIRILSPKFPGFGTMEGEIGGEVYFTGAPEAAGVLSYFLFGFWFVSVAAIFALISQRTAKLFRLFPPLVAYTLDISGSLCGIFAFMLLSWLRLPAPYWFLIAGPLFLGAMERGPRRLLLYTPLAFALIFIVALSQDARLHWNPHYRGSIEVHWSPYQKIEYTDQGRSVLSKIIHVNGIQHQTLLRLDQLPGSIYLGPHEHRKEAGLEPYRSVLIIGAGGGNDVAAALANGAVSVDAVEIDPVIAELGRRHHPEQPYSDPRVNLIVDDGRAFMARTRKRYDLIVFALTDSLIRVSAMSQLRLENYLFTEDSIRRAYGLLSETGDISLYNKYRRDWLIEKYKRMIHAATGDYPRVLLESWTTASLLVGPRTSAEAPPVLAGGDIDIPTDDWPFPYLKKRGIPRVYVIALAAVGLLILVMALLQHRLGRMRGEVRAIPSAKLAFFLMGVAFLLLETKSIVQFSLLFGTTWVNTSLVFAAVLLLVLAANWCASLLRHPSLLPVVSILLVASCLAVFLYPVGNLLRVESGLWRFLFASLMTFSPIFFANMVFSVSFRDQPLAEHIFGWNLLGASAGGLLEYTSMAIGYNALGVVVAACYTLVVLCIVAARRSGLRVRVGGEG